MTEPKPAPTASRPEPLSLLWRFFAAPPTLLILVSLLALSLVLSTLIPQIPQEQSADPQAWLAVEPGALNLNSGLVRTLGLSDLYHALWFRLLLALTGLALFTWTVDAADLAWRAARGRWTRAALALWGSRPLQDCVSSAYPAEEVQARLGSFLARQGYRWAGVADQPLPTGVAVRRLVALWAQPLALAALLMALLSLAVLANWGWQNEDWRPAVGGSQVIGHNTPYTLRLDAYTSDPDGEGRLAAESTVTWLEDDKTVAQDLVREGWPATRAGLAVRQVGQVPGVTIHGTDKAGESLRLQSGSGAAYESGLPSRRPKFST
jgi:hypothetical protein